MSRQTLDATVRTNVGETLLTVHVNAIAWVTRLTYFNKEKFASYDLEELIIKGILWEHGIAKHDVKSMSYDKA